MHSLKLGRSAFAHIIRLDAIGLLVTDQLPEAELRDALTAAEVEIVVASGLFWQAAEMVPFIGRIQLEVPVCHAIKNS